jgi:hypothetical protein
MDGLSGLNYAAPTVRIEERSWVNLERVTSDAVAGVANLRRCREAHLSIGYPVHRIHPRCAWLYRSIQVWIFHASRGPEQREALRTALGLARVHDIHTCARILMSEAKWLGIHVSASSVGVKNVHLYFDQAQTEPEIFKDNRARTLHLLRDSLREVLWTEMARRRAREYQGLEIVDRPLSLVTFQNLPPDDTRILRTIQNGSTMTGRRMNEEALTCPGCKEARVEDEYHRYVTCSRWTPLRAELVADLARAGFSLSDLGPPLLRVGLVPVGFSFLLRRFIPA